VEESKRRKVEEGECAKAYRKDFSLRDQLRRAAVSIPTNIAEGFERSSRKEYIHYLAIAKGSAGEVRSLLKISLEIGYLDSLCYAPLNSAVLELSRYLANYLKSLRRKP
jgi:four helix bundle protein